MQTKVLQSLQTAMQGKKLIRMSHTIDEGIDQTVLPITQEIWYKYPTLDEDILRPLFPAHRPFPNRNRDRLYTYDEVIWKMLADGYIQKQTDELLFFSYKKSTNLQEACAEYGFRELMPDYRLFKEIQDKNRLAEFGIDATHGEIPFITERIQHLPYAQATEHLGHKFVVQYSNDQRGFSSSGGRDTFIITSQEDYNLVLKKQYQSAARISQFITGTELGINAIATNRGTIVMDPYVQAIGIPELTNHPSMFCGIDFRLGRSLPPHVREEVRRITRHVGDILYRKNYRGTFGMDFLWQTGSDRVFVLEINPRFTAATNMINFSCIRQGILPLIALHFCEYLDCIPETFSIEEYERSIAGMMDGSLLYVRNRENTTVQLLKAPLPGIYEFPQNQPIFRREAFGIHQVNEPTECLVRQVHPLKRNLGPIERIFILQSDEGCLIDSHTLNDRFRQHIESLYAQCHFAPKDFYDSSVPYNSDTL